MTQQFRRHRYPTTMPVVVTTRRTRQTATLVDVNQGGARLRGLRDVVRGDHITLHVLNEQIAGQIRWCVQDRAGLAFLAPVRPALVDVMRQGVTRTLPGRQAAHLREMR